MCKILGLPLLFLVYCSSGCPTYQTTTTTNPPYLGMDGGIYPDCVQVCNHFRAHGCNEGNPTRQGEPCEAVCKAVHQSGFIDWDMRCLVMTMSCDEIPLCQPE